MNIEQERARLIDLRRSAIIGLSESVLSAIRLLKDHDILARDYNPGCHYLRWRAFPDSIKRKAMIGLPGDDDEKMTP